jgi:hypothetical protein
MKYGNLIPIFSQFASSNVLELHTEIINLFMTAGWSSYKTRGPGFKSVVSRDFCDKQLH